MARRNRRAPGLARTDGARENAEEGRGQRLDRQRAGVLRLLHLRAGRRAGLPERSSSRRTTRRSASSRRSPPSASATWRGPIGAFVLGHWGDTHGRKTVLVLCMLLMGGSTFAGRAAAHLQRDRHLGADPAGRPAADPGLRGRRRDLRRQRDDPGTFAVRSARLLRQLHPAGRAGRPDHRRRRLPAAVRDHVEGSLRVLGLAHPVPAQRAGGRRRLRHSPPGRRNPGLPGGGRARRGAGRSDRDGRPGERQRTCSGSSAWR